MVDVSSLFRPHHVEKTAAQVIQKQEKIDKWQKTSLGRFWIKITNTPKDYALSKLKSIRETAPDSLQAKQCFIRDLKIHPEHASKNLSLSEQFAIYEYANDAFVPMNNALRDTQSKHARNAYYVDLNKQATNALKKLSTEQNHFGLTFRGITGNHLAHLKEGDTMTEKGFMSTSKNANISKGFAVKDHEGNHGTMLYAFGKGGANILGQAKNSGEEEVLYSPGAQFKVLFSEKDHEATTKGWRGALETKKTNHVVLEEVGTPENKGHSGILDALDLAR